MVVRLEIKPGIPLDTDKLDADIAPIYDQNSFQRVSAFNRNQLAGQREGLVRLGYLRKLGTKLVDTYLGAFLECGGRQVSFGSGKQASSCTR
ncbi:MAG: hypothetical protein U9Q81_04725 [Pseudomonadota bacterium]|nr:hypothetical protein [Pseudomonadota bacterium]